MRLTGSGTVCSRMDLRGADELPTPCRVDGLAASGNPMGHSTSKQEIEMALPARRKMRAAEVSGKRAGGDRRNAVAAALATVLVAGAAMLWSAGHAHAATYKWVDEKGVVHYTDKLPPDAVDKASIELNKQGVPIKQTDKALTPEQRRAIEQDADKTRDAQRAKEEHERRDRALVASYTNEAEIDLARNRSLQTINNVILSSQAFSEQLNKRKVDVETKRDESKGKALAAVFDRELESIDAELQRQSELVTQKNKEAATITAKYDADKQRWRELSASKERSAAAGKVDTTSKPTAVKSDGTSTVVPTGTAKK